MTMVWFAATDAELAETIQLRVQRAGVDPFHKKPITIVGPKCDMERLGALPSFTVQYFEPPVVDVLLGRDALVELDHDTSPDASPELAPYVRGGGYLVHRLAQDAAARLASGAEGFAARLAERGLQAGAVIAISDALGRTLSAPLPADSAEDELVAAFSALLAAAGGGSIFAIGYEG
jgi:hypothetical protein